MATRTRRPPEADHVVTCETCGRLSARPLVTEPTGRMLAESHAKVEPAHRVTVAPAP